MSSVDTGQRQPPHCHTAGSSHLVPAITPPAQPCLYWKVQEELLTWTIFVNRVDFLHEKYIIAQKSRKKEPLSVEGISTACHRKIHPGSVWCCTNVGCPASKAGLYNHLYSCFYHTLLRSSFIKSFVIRQFLVETQKERCARSPLPTSAAGEEQRILRWACTDLSKIIN